MNVILNVIVFAIAAAFVLWLAYLGISIAVAKGVADGIRKSDIGTTIRSAILQAEMISVDEKGEDGE
jgi:hypothetical protein